MVRVAQSNKIRKKNKKKLISYLEWVTCYSPGPQKHTLRIAI